MQFQTIATLLAFAASTLAGAIDLNVDTRASCKPAYKDIIYDCGVSSDLFTAKSISMYPDEPVRGQKVYIKVSGYLKEKVTNGNIRVEASRGIFKVKRNYDLCENASQAGKECPFEKGDVTFDGSFDIEKELLPGKYNVDMHTTSSNGKTISSLNLKLNIR